MLNREQAQEQLQTFACPDALARRLAALAPLPPALATCGRTILGCDFSGQPWRHWDLQRQAEAALGPGLDGLAPADRQRLFTTLFPRFAPAVEAAWWLGRRLPYQGGSGRPSFRAPGLPAATQAARAAWLIHLAQVTLPYAQDLAWFAIWTPYLAGWGPDTLGILFAAALDAGGPAADDLFAVLTASARGEHPIGAMGRHVTRALLVAARPDGWAFIERLLLAAQREEGLRQAILETADEAHPEAFRRLLRLIVDHDLARFSATVRALNGWLGCGWDSAQVRAVNAVLAQLLRCLESADACAQALASPDAQTTYLALWALAFADAPAAVPVAARLLRDPVVERRFVATHLLGQLALPTAWPTLLPVLDDPDLRVAASAARALGQAREALADSDLFERVERLLPRFPRRRTLPTLIWPWTERTTGQSDLAGLLVANLGSRPVARLLPFLPLMDAGSRSVVATRLAAAGPADPAARAALFRLAGDRSGWVRDQACKALAKWQIAPDEAAQLEALLTRKGAPVRRSVLDLLRRQADAAALASAERLLAARHPQQRLAGLELLDQLRAAGRAVSAWRTCAERYAARGVRCAAESERLDLLLGHHPTHTLGDALGLLAAAQRTPPQAPRLAAPLARAWFFPHSLVSDAALACIQALDDLIHAHRTDEIRVPGWNGRTGEELLGNLHRLPDPVRATQGTAPELPLRAVWEAWWAARPPALCDPDGLEGLRALAPFQQRPYWSPYRAAGRPTAGPGWRTRLTRILYGRLDLQQLRYPGLVQSILEWLLYLHPPAGAVDLLLDATETTLALVPASVALPSAVESNLPDQEPTERQILTLLQQQLGGLAGLLSATGMSWAAVADFLNARLEGRSGAPPGGRWRTEGGHLGWLHLARRHRALCGAAWTPAHHARLWRLLRWLDEPGPGLARLRPQWDEIWAAFQTGAATDADLYDHLLGPREDPRWGGAFHDLEHLAGRKLPPAYDDLRLRTVVARCRERILSVELSRGDLPTAASSPALALRYAGDAQTVVRLLGALGAAGLVRGRPCGDAGKPVVLSHLIRATFPGPADTPAAFAALAGGVKPDPLIALALYAPQWAAQVEAALGWPGCADAVWWVHAHTKDPHWVGNPDLRDLWAAQTAERTPLTAQELQDGAVDVAWFHAVYAALGPERWDAVARAAKYAASGAAHARAQLFAAALRGQVSVAALRTRVETKRHADSVRALGLVPLAGGAAREADVQDRYALIQEFRRGGRKFGPGRQASEARAAAIALENLARTAGYPDALRLTWALEARSQADLAAGPLAVEAGDYTVRLALAGDGAPELTVQRGARHLRALPPALKKRPAVADLVARQRAIRQQIARTRAALEEAMCRGDRFLGAELHTLCAHPVLGPLLTRLIFLAEEGIGYPVDEGRALEAHDGRRTPVAPDAALRLAHPHDLLRRGDWDRWQQECFVRERVQPFKQVFRELYVRTAAETADGTHSQRYAGHQVQPQQALALLGARGWVASDEEGVRRTFHGAGLTATVRFLWGGGTPAEVEGLTLDTVEFTRRGEWTPLPLEAIPPAVFSEVMRDLDLVVSVAHRGGVDPEASASTVEMRAGLIRETCALLKLDNVRLQGAHALITGQLGTYSVHLGSAIVHRQPGGALCIVPVHSQHRGRLFLPFADDDPRTAEVLAKVLLLARDTAIKDPVILTQLLAA